MAIAVTTGLVHLPFGERPQYGMPYPEGIAVGHINQAGDATGGDITFTFNADGGFLYRLEVENIVRGVNTVVAGHVITSHAWAEEKSGLGASAFDLNWALTASAVSTQFAVYASSQGQSGQVGSVLPMVRRFPMGSLRSVNLQVILQVTLILGNIDTITHEVAYAFTYWRKSAISLPGFLSSFHEAPEVPPLLRA